MRDPEHPYEIEFYDDPTTGTEPVRDWIRVELTTYQRRALGVALYEVLQRNGVGVCGTEYGKQLGGGLFEFRLRHDADEIIGKHTARTPHGEPDAGPILLRVFCHAHGRQVILLLGGYDKAADPNKQREAKEIALARSRLAEYRRRATMKG